MIAVAVLGLASVALLGWRVAALGRVRGELRMPRASAIARLAPPVWRWRGPGHAGGERKAPIEDPQVGDTEQAVRERLYGSRPSAR